MKYLKTAFKFAKFAPTRKMLFASTFMLLVVGVMNICVGNAELGVICMIMSPYMLIQIPTNVCMSGIIGVSAKSRKMNINVVGAMGTFAMIMNVVIVSVLLVTGNVIFDFISDELVGQVLFNAGIASLMMGIYMVIGQKYFYISFVVFLAVFFGIFLGLERFGTELFMNMDLSVGIITYVVMTILSFICYHAFLRLFYKAPWDPRSMRTGLGG